MSNPPRSLGRYRIVGRLGAGAMGEVYLAEDPQIERHLAIKTVKLAGANDEEKSQRRERLLMEAKAAGKLVHPHVVTLFDAGEDDELVYLAFEFVDGTDLAKRMNDQPQLSIRDVLRIMKEAASGLEHAHSKGVVHRDVKPGNIMLTKAGITKIADFGIAKIRDDGSNLTQTGAFIGTPNYMSPEQVKAEPLDGRTDVFSLGCVLYELLHRERPFEGDTITTVVYRILNHDPTCDESRDDLPPALVELMASMLAKEADARLDARDCAAKLRGLESSLSAAILDTPCFGERLPSAAREEPMSLVPPPRASAPPPPRATSPAPVPPVATGSAVSASPPVPPSSPPPPTGSGAAPPPASGAAPQPVVASSGGSGGMARGSASAKPSNRNRNLAIAAAGCIGLALVGAIAGFFLFSRAQSWFTDQVEQAEASLQDELESLGEEIGAGDVIGGVAGQDLQDEQDGTEPVDPESLDSSEVEGTVEEGQTASIESEPQTQVRDAPARPTRAPTRTPTRRATPRPAATTNSVQAADANALDSTVADVVEPQPTPTQAPVVVRDESQAQLTTSRLLDLQVEPVETYVLVKAVGEGRYTQVGQAMEFDSRRRRTRNYSLPDAGEFFVMFRHEGYADYVVRVTASAGGSVATPVRVVMRRPGSSSNAIKVRDGVTFSGGKPMARVSVNGDSVGRVQRYSGAKLLDLSPGHHRIVVTTRGGTRYEFDVEVSDDAPVARRALDLQ